jgi:hypothetical protein
MSRHSGVPGEEMANPRHQLGWLLDAGNMPRAGNHLVLRTRNQISHRPDQIRRSRAILIADQAECRNLYAFDDFSMVSVAQCCTRPGITIDRLADQHVAAHGQHLALDTMKGWREPLFKHAICDCLDAIRPNRFDPVIPAFRRTDLMRGVGQDERPDNFGSPDTKPLRDQPADRKPADDDLIGTQMIDQAGEIINMVVDRLGRIGHVGEAVATLVIA